MIRCPRCGHNHPEHEPLFIAQALRAALAGPAGVVEVDPLRSAALLAALRLDGHCDSCAFVVASETQGEKPRRLLRVVELPDHGFASAEVGIGRLS